VGVENATVDALRNLVEDLIGAHVENL